MQFDDGDRLCLDGRRLIADGDRWYPEDGLEEIRLIGDLASTESYFVVRMPDGGRRFYGGQYARFHPERRVARADGTPGPGPLSTLTWLLSEERDTSGNIIQYQWSESNEILLHSIRWGARVGIDDPPRTVELDATARGVEFTYEDRPDRRESFQAGVQFLHTSRLIEIASRGPASSSERTVRNYRLTYETSDATERSLLVAIHESDHFGSTLTPVEFGYTERGVSTPAYTESEAMARPVPWWEREYHTMRYTAEFVIPVDLNGDSRDDLLYWDSNHEATECHEPTGFCLWDCNSASPPCWRWYVRISRPGGYDAPVPAGLPDLYVPLYTSIQSADLDRDGDAEVIYVRRSDAGNELVWDVYDWNGSGLTRRVNDFAGCGQERVDYRPLANLIGDFDGNGGVDVVHGCATDHDSASGEVTATQWTAAWQNDIAWWGWNEQAIPDLAGEIPETGLHGNSLLQSQFQSHVSDTDGDGRDELLFRPRESAEYWSFGLDPSASTVAGRVNLTAADDVHHVFLDANGDGLADALELDNVNGRVALRVNTGAGLSDPMVLPEYAPYPDLYQQRSHPSGGSAPNVVVKLRPSTIRVIDWNRDGRQDFLFLYEGPATVAIPELRPHTRVVLHTATANPSGIPAFRVTGLAMDPGIWASATQVFPATTTMDSNADSLPDLLTTGWDDVIRVHSQIGEVPDLLSEIRGDHSVATQFDHDSVARTGSGGKSFGDCEYPLACRPIAAPVVRRAWLPTDSAPAAYRELTRSYDGSRADVRGRGWLGFDRVVTVDEEGVTVTATYDHSFREPTETTASLGTYTYVSQGAAQVDTVVPMGGGAARLTREYREGMLAWLSADHRRWVRRPNYTNVWDYDEPIWTGDASTSPLRHHGSEYHWDEYGLLVKQITRSPGETSTIVIEREHRASDWILGLPKQIVLTSEPHSAPSATRVISQTFHDRGLLWTRTAHGVGAEWQQSTYTYYDNGNPWTVEHRGAEPVDLDGTAWRDIRRFHEIRYDIEGVLPTEVENSLHHVVRLTYHDALGVLLAVEDPNGLRTNRIYDGFGRPTWEDRPDGSWVETKYEVAAAPWAMRVDVRASDGSHVIVDWDDWGRARETRTLRLDGNWSLENVWYDGRGRIAARGLPRWEGDTSYPRTWYKYDGLDRVLSVDQDGRVTTYDYDGLSTAITDPESRTRIIELDEAGRLRATREGPEGLTAQFEYGAFGLLASMTTSGVDGSATWNLEYDAWGRRTVLDDPDSGTTRTVFDSFGGVRGERNGAGEELLIDRDELGRETVRTTTPDGTTRFVWDDEGAGRLAHACTDSDEVCTSFKYDAAGRLEVREMVLAGGGSYSTEYAYRASGQIGRVVYPDAPGRPRFALEYEYEAGTPTEVWEVDLPTGLRTRQFWRAEEISPAGSIALEYLAGGQMRTRRERDEATGELDLVLTQRRISGSVWETVQEQAFTYYDNGNVESRDNVVTGRHESFTYDTVNRIDSWTVGGATTNFDHDSFGNLVRLGSRVQTFGPPSSGGGSYGPHAVRTSGSYSYSYDEAGRQVSGGTRLDVEYAWSGLPRSITTSTSTTSFTYDAWGARVRRWSGSGSTVYVDDIFERREEDGEVEYVYHVFAPGREVCQVTRRGSGEEDVHYLHTDHQGTIEAVTSAAGSLVERFAFAPFGERVGAAPAATQLHHRWVGHEQDDELELTNMRGRMYDPRTGRFLTTDPLSVSPWAGQSRNAYSYVLGNPATSQDPTGLHCIGASECGWAATHGGDRDSALVGPPGGLQGIEIGSGVGDSYDPGERFAWNPPNYDPARDPSAQFYRDFYRDHGFDHMDRAVHGAAYLGGVGAVAAPLAGEVLIGEMAAGAVATVEAQVAGASAAVQAVAARLLAGPFGVLHAVATDWMYAEVTGGLSLGAAGAIGATGVALDTAGPGLTRMAAGGRASVVLDANALIEAVERGREVLGGRVPVVPIQAAKEFLKGMNASPAALREWLIANGGRIGLAGQEAVAARLRQQAVGLGRVLRLEDSRVAAGAMREGLVVITNDKKFGNFLRAIGYPTERF